MPYYSSLFYLPNDSKTVTKTVHCTDKFLGPENDSPKLKISPKILPFGMPWWLVFDIFSDIWAHRRPRDPQMHPKAPKSRQQGATRVPPGTPTQPKLYKMISKVDPQVLRKQPLLDSLIQWPNSPGCQMTNSPWGTVAGCKQLDIYIYISIWRIYI